MKKIILIFIFGFLALPVVVAQSAGFNNGFALISTNGGPNGFYCLQPNCGINPNLQGFDFGQIALDTGSLVLNGVEINNWTCGGANISNVDMYYRVFPFGNPGGAFIERDIFFNFGFPNGCSGADMQWLKFADNNNLVAGITQPGVYEVELYVRQTTSSNGFQFMSNGGVNYRAQFEVVCSLSPLNGTYDIPSDCFPTMISAVNYLNSFGISGPVTFNVAAGYTETAPPGGFRITGTGSAANPIVFQKSGAGANPTFTAGEHVIGRRNDAVLKIVGADYITLDGFTLLENPANTVLSPIGSNTMTEFGVALLYESTTNGAQHNTIQNCVISLNRNYRNSFGIYSNSTHSDSNNLTVASALSIDGTNNGLQIFNNEISNVNVGIVVVGPQAQDLHQNGLTIGGSLSQGNTISNYGRGNLLTAPNNVSGLSNGIYLKNVRNFDISYNSITSTDGGIIEGQQRGIFVNEANNIDLVNVSVNTISHNSFTIRLGVNSIISGIECRTTSTNTLSTLNIDNNSFSNFGHTIPATANINFIFNSTQAQNVSISGNSIFNNTVNTSGTISFINNANPVRPNNSIYNLNNNTFENFTKLTPGATLWGINSGQTSTNSVIENINGNTFENITINGATVFNGIASTWGDNVVKTANNNNFNNINGGTSNLVLMNLANSQPGGSIAFNTISNVTGGAEIQNITIGSGTQNVHNNIIHTATTSGTTISGIRIAGGSGYDIYQNKIYNLTSTTTGNSSSVNGIVATTGANFRVYNNVVGDLNAPDVNSVDAIRGISLVTVLFTNTHVAHNTVYLNATSTGANFGTSGIYLGGNTNPLVNNHTLQNNLIVNTSTPNGTGRTIAFRRSTIDLDNYNPNSDRNAFYVGTPSANRVVFQNNTTPYSTLENFQTLVFPREQNSVYEEPVWASTNGADANYLKLEDGPYPSQMESGGLLVTTPVTIDFDHVDEVRPGGVGVVNGGGQQVDIGAYEFDAIPYDRIPPVITYTPLTGGCGQPEILLNNVQITDIHPGNVGVVTTGAFVPRVYYRQNAGAWQSEPGILFSGDTFDGIWSFEITGLSTGNIEYFVIAQDNNGNLSALPDADLVATDVLTIIDFPSNPNILSFPVTVWNGSWNPSAPDSQTRVVIQAPYDTAVHGSFEACECFVEIGVSVVIAGGDYIQLQGGLNNQGTFTIQNSGSLVQIFDQPNVGTITVDRIANNVNKYDYVYWSSPVQGYNLSNIIGTSSRFRWGPVTPNANGGLGNWINYSGVMNIGEGYIVRAPNSFPIVPDPGTTILTSFDGVPNNGTISVTIQRGDMTVTTVPSVYSNPALSIEDDNFNLLGNPYPSALSTNAFLQYNSVTNPQIEGSVRLWTHGTVPDTGFANPFFDSYTYNYTPNDYIIYNLSGAQSGPTAFGGFIASGQGFFVLMNEGDADTGTVIFSNDMRNITHNNSQFFRTQQPESLNEEKHRIWLDLVQQANGANVRTLVGYVPGATYAKDVLYDAWVKPGNQLNLYSLTEGQTLGIQGRPFPFDVNDKVPLGYVAPQSGNYSITIAFTDGLFAPENGQLIFLEDKLTGNTHLLNLGPYSFQTDSGQNDQRFVLRYSYETLTVSDIIDNEFDVLVWSKQEEIIIKSQGSSIREIKVFDLYGRKLWDERSLSLTEVILYSLIPNQSTLMVVVYLENGLKVIKKVVH